MGVVLISLLLALFFVMFVVRSRGGGTEVGFPADDAPPAVKFVPAELLEPATTKMFENQLFAGRGTSSSGGNEAGWAVDDTEYLDVEPERQKGCDGTGYLDVEPERQEGGNDEASEEEVEGGLYYNV